MEATIMKLAVAVLTYNRLPMLQRTLASMDAGAVHPFDRVVVDGGSADPAQRAFVAEQPHFYQFPERVTVGASMNKAIELALAFGPEIVVFSADDYFYKVGWQSVLARFWRAAPADIALATLNWEPTYPWNTVEADEIIGGVRTLIRASVPGSSWSFRAADWPMIGPIADKTGGEDHEVNQKLRAAGRRLAALNLTEHIGERESAWGNQSWTIAKPLVV